MKKNRSALFLVVMGALLPVQFACELDIINPSSDLYPDLKEWSITIYGLTSCSHCIKLKSDLDADSIRYTYFDVSQDAAAKSRMQHMLNTFGYGMVSVYYPVVEVVVEHTLHVFFRPNVEEQIKPLISGG